MAHLSFEYSANLEPKLDLQAFCDLMRDVMRDSGVFLLGGIRVRGTRVDVCAVASGERWAEGNPHTTADEACESPSGACRVALPVEALLPLPEALKKQDSWRSIKRSA